MLPVAAGRMHGGMGRGKHAVNRRALAFEWVAWHCGWVVSRCVRGRCGRLTVEGRWFGGLTKMPCTSAEGGALCRWGRGVGGSRGCGATNGGLTGAVAGGGVPLGHTCNARTPRPQSPPAAGQPPPPNGMGDASGAWLPSAPVAQRRLQGLSLGHGSWFWVLAGPRPMAPPSQRCARPKAWGRYGSPGGYLTPVATAHGGACPCGGAPRDLVRPPGNRSGDLSSAVGLSYRWTNRNREWGGGKPSDVTALQRGWGGGVCILHRAFDQPGSGRGIVNIMSAIGARCRLQCQDA